MELASVSSQAGRTCRRLDRSYNKGHRKTSGFDSGWALALHRRYDDSLQSLVRSEQGELVNRMKYYFDSRALDILAEQMIQRITDRLSELGRDTSLFDAIIPVPPSVLDRPFQPVLVMARKIAHALNIPFDAGLVYKEPTAKPVKELETYDAKITHLQRVLRVADKRYSGKRVLVIDDIVDSGATFDTVSSKLKIQGEVRHVYVLCVTETLTKR